MIGLVKFDNSSQAQTLSDTNLPSNAPTSPPSSQIPPPPQNQSYVWGIIRFEQLEYVAGGGISVYVCNATNITDQLTQLCIMTPIFPFGIDPNSVAGGTLQYSGNYECPLPRRLVNPVQMVEMVVARVNDAQTVTLDVWGRVSLCTGCQAINNVPPQGAGATQRDLAKVFGVYNDVSRFLLYTSVLLCVQTVFSLVLTWERRRNQFIIIVICSLAALQDVLLTIFSARNLLGSSQQQADTTCTALGSVFHLVLSCAVAWYAAISVNLFVLFFRSGYYRAAAYHYSRATRITYHVTCWGYALLSFVLVWVLRAFNTGWSYGTLPPYDFCWISSTYVLLGCFFVPAMMVMALNLVLTIMMIVSIVRVRSNSRRFNVSSLVEITSVTLVVNMGILAIGLMGILLILLTNNPPPVLLLVSSIFFFLQAFTMWIVFFPRKENFVLWTMFFCCKLGRLQRKNTSLGSMKETSSSTTLSSSASSLSSSSSDHPSSALKKKKKPHEDEMPSESARNLQLAATQEIGTLEL